MKTFIRNEKLMGTAFSLGVVSKTEQEANHWLDIGVSEVKRIENLLSEYLPNSTTALINANAGNKAFEINPETFALLVRCLDISRLTKGDFDITVSPLKKLYTFKNTIFKMPEASKIKQVLEGVGYDKIILNKKHTTIRFKHPHMKISFNAIGKGYASDMVKKLWKQEGLSSGFINASGDLTAFGCKPSMRPWEVGISNPDKTNKPLLHIPIRNASVATSGDYEQYFHWNGKRYSHNINPITGLPLTGIKSVSILSPSAELSDALATAAYVKGIKLGLDFINQLPQTHGIFIDETNKLFFSKDLEYENGII